MRRRSQHGEPEKQERTGPPPCDQCPKGSPEDEHLHVLSRRNLRTVSLYFEAAGAGGPPSDLREDRILRRNFALIDRMVKAEEESSATRQMLDVLILMRGSQT